MVMKLKNSYTYDNQYCVNMDEAGPKPVISNTFSSHFARQTTSVLIINFQFLSTPISSSSVEIIKGRKGTDGRQDIDVRSSNRLWSMVTQCGVVRLSLFCVSTFHFLCLYV